MTAPLVLTLALEERSQRRFEHERATLFPAGRTHVSAHVTLFHALPASLRPDVEQALAPLADQPPPEVRVTGVRSLGRGAAYDVSCPQVQEWHRAWQCRWAAELTRQDAAGLRLHVTVQNKVDPALARHTVARLQQQFEPWTTTAVALRLWRYDGGPWTHLADTVFTGPRDRRAASPRGC